MGKKCFNMRSLYFPSLWKIMVTLISKLDRHKWIKNYLANRTLRLTLQFWQNTTTHTYLLKLCLSGRCQCLNKALKHMDKKVLLITKIHFIPLMSQAIKAFYSTYSFPIFHPAVWINQTSKQVCGYFNLSKQA